VTEISPRDFAEPTGTSFRDVLVRATPRFWVTPVLIAANVLYFVFAVARGVSPVQPGTEELQALGAIYGLSILDGEWWRLLTAAFVHVGFVHLAFNMWALWNLGNVAERMFGNLTFLLIYLVSAIGGSLASLLWHPQITSAGASGAIFGVAGALVAFLRVGRIDVPREVVRQLLSSLVFVVGFNLIFGAVVPGIDNAGHIGGLAVGLLSGAVLNRSLPSGRRSYRRYLLIPVLFLLFLLAGRIALERSPNHPELLAEKATKLQGEGRNAEAVEELTRAVERDPEFVEGFVQLGRLHLEANRFEEAIAAFERAVGLAPESAPLETALGAAYARAERYDDAIAAFKKAIDLDPQLYAPQSELAITLAQAGREEEAMEAFRIAKQMEPSDISNYLRWSYVLAEANRTDEALEVLAEARTWDPDSAPIESAVGLVQLRRGEIALAVSALQKAAEREPDVAEHHNRLALALAKSNAPDEALRAIEKAMELEPGAHHLLDSLGTVRLYRGEPVEAAEAYRRAITLAPGVAIYHFNLSIALARQGRREEGAIERAEAARLDPSLETPPDGQPII
jgi:rhomboid protease GluP